MGNFQNRPALRNDTGEQQIRRYVHSPLTVEHNGINASITENGKVILSAIAKDSPAGGDMVEYDEVEIPASLVFKLASLLKATRKVKYVNVADLKESDRHDSTEEG